MKGFDIGIQMPHEMQSEWDSSWLDSGNKSYLENQFEIFLKNPSALSEQWQNYFKNISPFDSNSPDLSHADIKEFFKRLSYRRGTEDAGHGTGDAWRGTEAAPYQLQQTMVQKLIFAYRLLGHQQSNINPLLDKPQKSIPQLEPQFYGLDNNLDTKFVCEDLAGDSSRSLAKIIADLKTIYCGTIASEYMHIVNSEERLWVQTNLENTVLSLAANKEQKLHILELVIAADGLEKYLGAKYPGAKRFSLEGCDSLIVGLDEIISYGGKQGIQEIVIAMTHRGRLNVLVNLLGKMPSELFDQFEEKNNIRLESGDVKYHQGFSSDLQTEGGNVHVSLAFNPSHLEIVTPVAYGSVRARQERRADKGSEHVMCVAIHGDAAFAGQGIVMECLNMSATRGYGIGGTLHIIVNNQIGFTTSNPKDARSTLYCSDIGKMLAAPVFHINADDPEAVAAITKLALAYKLKFKKDVIIDLIGYRRMGHNEADEPAATQPLMYKTIRAHPTLKKIYGDLLVEQAIISPEAIEKISDEYRNTLDQRDKAVVKRLADRDWKSAFASDWTPYGTGDWRSTISTKLPIDTLKQLASIRDAVPEGFTLDPRVKKIVEARVQMTQTGQALDWGYAETLAYATLLNAGYGVRLSGQDCSRGTFFHRHAQWHDHENGNTYISLEHLNKNQAKFWLYDSLLSEAGVLGFEYGYSSSEPRTLTLWEAQFGDFANGAQVVIDQFISSGEQKWGRLSGLVLLLPHGYEGQGPEHSSAKIERYLQMCAQHNIQVCIPSTPAQMYHMLRRQMLRPMRKALVTITPKSLLRHKAAISTLDELANGEFQVVIPDANINYSAINKLILCSGKVYYELEQARLNLQTNNIAILRVEQLYPFPEQELIQELSKYDNANKVVWCQEEPQNQGAWYSLQHNIRNCLKPQQQLIYAGRAASASPAVGYFPLHEQQQQNLIRAAISET